MTDPRAVAFGCAACAALGCGTVEYAPRAPVSIEAGSARAEVIEIETPGGEIRYSTVLRTPPGTELRRVRLRPRAETVEVPTWPDSDCTAKNDAIWVERDGQRLTLPSAIGGEQRVDVGFSIWDQYCVPESLELELANAGATRAVVVPLDIPAGWEVENPFAMSAGLSTEFATAEVTGVIAIMAVTVGFSMWQGPLRWTVEPGAVGIAVCDENTCPPDGGGRSVGLVVPLGAGVTWYPWVDDPDNYNPRGPFAVGLELRVREYLSWLPAYDGTELRFLHTPQAVFHLVTTSGQAAHGLPAGPRLGSFDLEISGGALIARDDGDTDASFLIGASFGLHWWL